MVGGTYGFEGKYRYQSAQGRFMGVDMEDGRIVFLEEKDGCGRFNLYNGPAGRNVLQAMNGLYVSVRDSGGLRADKEQGDGDGFSVFAGEDGGVVFLYEAKDGRKYYICEDGMEAVMCPAVEGEEPPPGARFTCAALAPGLKQIKIKGAAKADLDWADLRGAGALDGLDFTGCSAFSADMYGLSLHKSKFCSSGLEKINLKNAVFREADFSGCAMNGANLCMANGKDCSFQGACLDQCDLRYFMGDGGRFAGAGMVRSDCGHAYFRNADFGKAAMRNSGLQHVIWDGCSLLGADLSGADLTAVNFRLVKLDGSTVLNGAILKNCNFRSMDLKGINMSHSSLPGAYFDGADLTGADLSYSNLTGAHFTKQAVLAGASLANSYLEGADFTGAQLGYSGDGYTKEIIQNSADLTGAYMPNAVMDQANMMGVNMSGVNWYGSKASAVGAYMHQVNFSNANLGSMSFDQASLNGSTFDYANLIGCSFMRAVLRPDGKARRVSFAYANIQGADFFESQIEDAVFSNAGAAMTIEWDFSLAGDRAARYREELNRNLEPISEALAEEFRSRDFELPADGVSRVRAADYRWDILSKSSPDIAAYELSMENGQIEVRSGPAGVPLFRFGDEGGGIREGLDGWQIPQALKDEMKKAGYALKDIASVCRVTAGRTWGLDNDLKDGRTLQRGYLEFYITADQDGMFTVFGTILGTVHRGDDGVLEQERHIMASTGWIPDLLRGDSICPSGHKIDVVTDPRPEVRMTWKEAVTADTLPQEPECIPSPYTWCSPERGCSIRCTE